MAAPSYTTIGLASLWRDDGVQSVAEPVSGMGVGCGAQSTVLPVGVRDTLAVTVPPMPGQYVAVFVELWPADTGEPLVTLK
jgi:hypothetical protein